MKKIFPSAVVLSLIFGLLSCSKEGPTGPAGATGATGATGPAGPGYTGVISGHVSLYDQYGSRVLTGLAGVQLNLNGSVARAAITDTTGFYRFDSVVTGDYTIKVSDTATTPYTFGSYFVDNFQFLADTLNHDVKLSAVPSFNPSTIAVYSSSIVSGDSVVISYPSDTRARALILFVNNTSSVNGTPSGYLTYYTKTLSTNPAVTTTFIEVPTQDLLDAGFTPGSSVYLAVYSYPVNDYSTYEDYSTGKTVFNSLGTSPVTTTTTTP
jgi:hypothetical protein